MEKCDEMFYKTFPDVFKENDVAIIVWREAWKAALEDCLEGFEKAMGK